MAAIGSAMVKPKSITVTNNGERWHPEQLVQKQDEGVRANVGTSRFVFTNFQADKYDTSSGDAEGNRVYS